ncbi:transglycosylase SLT domain-containing protein [uncultured Sphingomonas sp.]|uniref:transglycosylase SLT domain-containing protein n=1 Tax=uncultured Sphingomonas sp. TaxID=158754 RepID=UPI0035CA2F47
MPIVVVVGSPSAYAAPPAMSPTASCRAHAPEASTRSGIAVDVILRVMRAESGGNPDIVSTKGAIGCMQIMPATWAYLSPRYSLGKAPYNALMYMTAAHCIWPSLHAGSDGRVRRSKEAWRGALRRAD